MECQVTVMLYWLQKTRGTSITKALIGRASRGRSSNADQLYSRSGQAQCFIIFFWPEVWGKEKPLYTKRLWTVLSYGSIWPRFDLQAARWTAYTKG